MTVQDLEEYEARLTWVKALDAATEATLAMIQATLASNRRANRRRTGAEVPLVFHHQHVRLQPQASDRSATAVVEAAARRQLAIASRVGSRKA